MSRCLNEKTPITIIEMTEWEFLHSAGNQGFTKTKAGIPFTAWIMEAGYPFLSLSIASHSPFR